MENNNAKPFLSVFRAHITDITQWFCTIKHSHSHAKNYIQKLTGRRLWMCVTTATICQRECQEKASTIEWCICFMRKCSLFLLFFFFFAATPPFQQKWKSAENQLYAWRRNSLQICKTWNGCSVRAFRTFRHALMSPGGFPINRKCDARGTL